MLASNMAEIVLRPKVLCERVYHKTGPQGLASCVRQYCYRLPCVQVRVAQTRLNE